jgi:ABC-type Fe3+ transport system substrate-binding protein
MLNGVGGRCADLVIVSPHTQAIRAEFDSGFSGWHQEHYGEPVRIDWRDAGGTSDCLRFVLSEFAKREDGIGIDCFFGGGQEPYLLLADRRLVLPYAPGESVLAGIPQTLNGAELYDAGHRWYGVALSSFGMLQNRRVQERMRLPQVARWEQLADPRLWGWVGAGDPRNSGTMNVMFESFLQACGWERGWGLLTRIGGNVRQFDRVSSSTAKDVTLGDTAYAFAIDFYALVQVAAVGRSNLAFILPEDFAAVSPDGLAILRGAPNLRTAQRFVDFALREEGQKLWVLPRGHPEGPRRSSIERMSVRPDLYRRYREVSNIEASPFEREQVFRYDGKLARERREVVAALAGALLVDTHADLKRAWAAVCERGMLAADLAELDRVPLSADEAARLAVEGWREAAVRNRMKTVWQRWAQSKYRRLADESERAQAAHRSGIHSGSGRR